ncbi:MAG: hypothetical protein JHC33_07985 [Ignisphaera sp.]|nr:hypothetical protein [Ignisphaera sp.]
MAQYQHTFTAYDTNGLPLANGYLYTYYSGMDLPTPTYHLVGESTFVKNAWPLQLDINGHAIFYTEYESFPNRYNVKDHNFCQLPNYPIDKVINLQQKTATAVNPQ